MIYSENTCIFIWSCSEKTSVVFGVRVLSILVNSYSGGIFYLSVGSRSTTTSLAFARTIRMRYGAMGDSMYLGLDSTTTPLARALSPAGCLLLIPCF